MNKPFLPYAHQSIDSSDIQAVVDSLKKDLITRGSCVESFEKGVANFCEVEHAVAFSSGTAALMAAYAASGMGPADRLISTPNTFVATIGAACLRGANPVFVDIDSQTGNLNIEQVVINAESSSTRGKTFLAPVHFAGIAVDMKTLYEKTLRKNVTIIEDAAHAIGSRYPSGEKVGCCKYSDMTMFSFHPAKTITTAEGGMVVTNNEDLAHLLRRYRNNGIERDQMYLTEGKQAPWYYEVQEISGNFHVTEMQGALGLSQLKRIDAFITKRRLLVKHYRTLLKDIPQIELLTDKADDYTAFHLMVAKIDFKTIKKDRTEFMKALSDVGIGTQLHYIPVYEHPYFRKRMGDIRDYFPHMEKYYSQALSLPLYYDLTLADVERVCKELKKLID